MTDYYKKVEELLDQGVNPAIAAHNGFVVLAGVDHSSPTKIILEFHGGCAGCPASFTFTLKTIQKYLREELSEDDLVVINAEST